MSINNALDSTCKFDFFSNLTSSKQSGKSPEVVWNEYLLTNGARLQKEADDRKERLLEERRQEKARQDAYAEIMKKKVLKLKKALDESGIEIEIVGDGDGDYFSMSVSVDGEQIISNMYNFEFNNFKDKSDE